eukprot:CAMPEP_0172066016 /NCGR_PEP_ID=MMETSP1043-20130122/10939_1 /TAXON_ID=464988 /ORGANISM="Hemiselmis andersenii, Strain CCMP441" /LENGTH=116 /DNA_ID=CAMNT_0012726153 /DNA_START=46 /DNA_END=396 /DNA_ORIENTATION=+
MTSAAALSTLHLCSAPTSSDRSSFGGGSRGALPGDCGDTPTSGQEHDEPPAAAADALVGCCASWGGGAAPAAGCWEAWPACVRTASSSCLCWCWWWSCALFDRFGPPLWAWRKSSW